MKQSTTLPPALRQTDRTHVRQDGRVLVYFGGCDYFRLSRDPRVLAAMRRGLAKYGLNVSASRMTTGNHPLYGRLEKELADFFGVESATLAPNGWAPNVMAAETLAGQFSHVLLDERAHPSLAAAARLMDCPVIKFHHRDRNDLQRIVKRLGHSMPLLMSDGMFSHDGGIAPLRDYLKVLPRSGMVLLDDAHGAGLLGATGRGAAEHAGVAPGRLAQTVTFSKAFGVFGGAVLGTRKLKAALIARSGVFIGSTPLPLPLANAALTLLAILRVGGGLRRRLWRNVKHLRERLRAGGLPVTETPGPIVSVAPANTREELALKRRLLDAGIHPPFIRYPGGPENGYFRFAISSEHTRAQLDALAEALTAHPLRRQPSPPFP